MYVIFNYTIFIVYTYQETAWTGWCDTTSPEPPCWARCQTMPLCQPQALNRSHGLAAL